MQLGMIGLGRMGANMVRRLMKNGHECVVYDRSPATVAQLVSDGAKGSGSLDEFLKKLKPPRAVWLMVPAAAVDATLADLAPKMEKGDIIIDGGNSYYIDDIRRAQELKARGIHYVDVGTSGGVWGLERGYCHDDRRRNGDRQASGSDLQDAGARPGQRIPHAGPRQGRLAPPRTAICTAGRAALVTSSRWCTTGSSTASWRHTPKG